MAKLALDNAEWLSTLSEPLKNDIESIMTQRLPSEGDCLLKEGEIIDRFIIVEAGTLIRTKSTDANGPLPLDELGAGNVTGFLHVESSKRILYPTSSPRVHPNSSDTRFATETAATRLG